jgi:hypothetical protein
MDARPLRDVLADLAGDAGARAAYGADPAGYLAAHGHADLPEPLVSEAVVSYADTAPVEVAAALAPYVAAHGPVPDASADPADWFDLLTSAELPGEDLDEPAEVADVAGDWADPGELDFGAGAGPAAAPSAVAVPDEETEEPVAVEETAPEPEWSPATFTPEPPIEGLAPDEDDDDDEDVLD